jgi:peptide/nickel transport system substrate-binding protein
MPARIAATDPLKQVTEILASGPFRLKADERVQGAHYAYELFVGYVRRPDGNVE